MSAIRHPSAAKIRFYRILGENIRKHREEQGMTQAELSELVGVSASSIDKWEHGLTSVPAFDLDRLADVLDVNHYDLVPSSDEDDDADEAAA